MTNIINRPWLAFVSFVMVTIVVCVITFKPFSIPPQYEIPLLRSSVNQPSLPYKWRVESKDKGEHHFSFGIRPQDIPEWPVALYIPYYEQNITLAMNGQHIDLFGLLSANKGPFERSSVFLKLDKKWFEQTYIQLDITVDTGKFVFGGISSVYVGPYDILYPRHAWEYFFHNDIKTLVFCINILLCFTCAMTFYFRHKDVSAIWLSGFYLISSLVDSGVLISRFPFVAYALPWFFLLTPIMSLCFLQFRENKCNSRFTKCILLVSSVCYALILFAILMFDVPISTVIVTVTIPVTIIISIFAIYKYFRGLLLKDNGYDALIIMSCLLVIIALTHDVAAKLSIQNVDIHFATIPRLLLALVLALLLVRQQTKTANNLDVAAKETQMKLEQKERELSRLFEEQNAQSQKIASEQERQRITSDLHDGVAGQLVTILALIESGESTDENLNEIANSALTDLRMVIETLALPDGELRSALATFRERCVAPLHQLGIEIDWDLIDLPAIDYLTAEQVLSILRLIQEAITNALKHGKTKYIGVHGSSVDDGMARISVTNRGGIPFVRSEERHGIVNMRNRASKLNGKFFISAYKDGAIVEVLIPISQNCTPLK